VNPKKHSPLPKSKRLTFLDVLQSQQKKDNIPGPGHYENKRRPKVLGAYNLKEEKLGFIEEA
jgi:hypothetical protein